MSDNTINSISSAGSLNVNPAPIRTGGTGQADQAAPGLPVSGKTEQAGLKPGAPLIQDSTSPKAGAPALPDHTAQNQDNPVTNGDNVEIRFRVDRNTKNITVFLVDRASKRVLRAIPPEELNKLQPGDLVELTR